MRPSAFRPRPGQPLRRRRSRRRRSRRKRQRGARLPRRRGAAREQVTQEGSSPDSGWNVNATMTGCGRAGLLHVCHAGQLRVSCEPAACIATACVPCEGGRVRGREWGGGCADRRGRRGCAGGGDAWAGGGARAAARAGGGALTGGAGVAIMDGADGAADAPTSKMLIKSQKTTKYRTFPWSFPNNISNWAPNGPCRRVFILVILSSFSTSPSGPAAMESESACS